MLRSLLVLALLAAPVHADPDRHAAGGYATTSCDCGRSHAPLSRREARRSIRERRDAGASYHSSGYVAPGHAAYGAFAGYGGLAYSPYGPAYFGARGRRSYRRE